MKRKFSILSIILLITSFFFTGCAQNTDSELLNIMKVHYIDVGQGDAILVQVNNKNLLIDSGSRKNQNDLFDYLDSLKIDSLDYVIATHPHEDHIGNMADVINNYEVSNFYAPKVEHTSKTFEKMIEALKDNNLKINVIKAGTDSINLGDNTKVSVFSPIKEETDNLNNYSPIMKIEYGSTSFLFTGDAEKEVEEEVINAGYNLDSDVLKLGHHGSSTSTSEDFYNAVRPSLCVISVGKDNSYGHPHKETLTLLNKSKMNFLRTDNNGTVLITSNGKEIKQIK
ncbi:MAG: MBL fold metallo-hydrolase [Clostridiales bacterium]|nr:MBL fold metallo-hydrolase [Clostridiales bacterium]